ncbi:MAG: hypothetical protein ACK45H_02390, partial [Bacteroidota bacterium]
FNAVYNGGTDVATIDVTQVPFTPEFITTSSCGLPNTTVTFEVEAEPGVTYTWTPPVNSTIIFGQSTDSVRVKFASQFNSGMLSVVASNLCGTSPAAEFFILAPPRRPMAIIGSATACTAVPSQLYRVDSVAYASYYIWGMPSGATIISSPVTNDSVNVMFQNFTSGAMSVKSANACGSSTMRYLTVSSPSLAAATGISGPQSVCSFVGTGQTVTYSTPVVSGITNYIWTMPAGASIISGAGSNTIGVQFANGFTGGSISVVLSNGCSLSQPTAIQLAGVSSGGSPQPIAMNGLSSVCSLIGSGSTVYSVTPPVGANSYVWSVPSGATIISGQGTASITVSYSAGFVSGQISVTVNTLCGAVYQQSKTITKVPSAAGSIGGPTCITTGSSYTYSISAVTGATTYTWTVPANASIISGQGTTTVTVQFNTQFSGGSISVTPTNSCGNGGSSSLVVGLSPILPGEIIGPLTACSGDQLTYFVNAVPGATSYIWGLPVGMSFAPNTSQSGASIVVVVDAAFISGVISVKSVTGCGSSTMRYSDLISNAGCSPQLILNDTDTINPIAEEYELIEKAYISDAVGGYMQFIFENSIGLEQIEILITDSTGKNVYRADESTNAGFNSFSIDLRYLEPGTYLFIIKDEEQRELLRKEISVESQ